jgi:hypothetical protein
MLTFNRVTMKRADDFAAHPTPGAVLPHGFVTALIIKNLNTALVWPGCEQSERK